MNSRHIALVAAVALALATGPADADIGWSPEQYDQAYGQGQHSFAKVNERGYVVGQNHLVVELTPDSTSSVAELWVLGLNQDAIPEKVKQAAAAAQKGPEVERVHFKARSGIPAEIRETVVDGTVVRVDVRNQALMRIAFCSKVPECSWWQRLFGSCAPTHNGCPVLDRALRVDRTMDEMHRRAEDAVERSAQ